MVCQQDGHPPQSQDAKKKETEALKDRAYKIYFGIYFGKDRPSVKSDGSPARVPLLLLSDVVSISHASCRSPHVSRKAKHTCY